GGGAAAIIGPNLATPSEPPSAPKLAAIATQAASSAKREDRDCGAIASAFGSGRLKATMAVAGSASWAAGGRVGASILGSAFGSILGSIFSILGSIFSSALASIFAASLVSILGAAVSGLAASGAIDGASVTVRVGSILGVSSLDMGRIPMERNSSIG